ncbi:MAG: cell division protein FtsQ/DivIB [Spirochaetia bacterium]
MADQAVMSSPKPGGGKFLSVVIYILLIIIVLELVFHLAIAPKLVIRNIRVETSLDIAKEDVLRIAGVAGDDYFFSVKPGTVKENLERYALVKRAEVERIFPDTLNIVLIPRKPVTAAFVETEGSNQLLVFDEDGVAFERWSTGDAGTLPILSGIQFENFNVGDRLPQPLLDTMRELKTLRLEKPALYQTLSEISFSRGRGNELDITVYPVHKPVKLLFGPRMTAELLHSALRLMSVLERNGVIEPGSEIDFRFGDVIYRKQGE